MIRLPKCTSHRYSTDCGYEYECIAKHGESCEDCLCTYHDIGGLYNPNTGKKVNKIVAFFLYGRRCRDLYKRNKP